MRCMRFCKFSSQKKVISKLNEPRLLHQSPLVSVFSVPCGEDRRPDQAQRLDPNECSATALLQEQRLLPLLWKHWDHHARRQRSLCCHRLSGATNPRRLLLSSGWCEYPSLFFLIVRAKLKYNGCAVLGLIRIRNSYQWRDDADLEEDYYDNDGDKKGGARWIWWIWEIYKSAGAELSRIKTRNVSKIVKKM